MPAPSPIRYQRRRLALAACLVAAVAVAGYLVVRRSPAPLRHPAAAVSPARPAPSLSPASSASPTVSPTVSPTAVPGPLVTGAATNVYAHTAVGDFSPAVAGVPSRVYVPNSEANTVDVIDPASYKVIASFPVPTRPQHVVPASDMKTLYVNSDLGNALTPINPVTGQPGTPIPVTDPYNLYFSPDGTKAIVVPELYHALDFRDPHTFTLIKRVPLPCHDPNHMDFTADGTSLVVSCEGSGQLVRVDVNTMTVTGEVSVGKSPQDIRLSPDGSVFYVADQDTGGVSLIDAATLAKVGFLATGKGAHGMYPSRDASELYVSNRLAGTVSVISYATRQIVATWQVPGGSPDMGGVSADGTQLWLSGRYNRAVYVIDTRTGALQTIPVGNSPHGLCVFPQPGSISLGHTGNYR